MTLEQDARVPASPNAGVAAVSPDLPAAATDRIRQSMSASRAEGTLRAYASAWRRFENWCTAGGHTALPAHPVTVAAYLVDAADTFTPDGQRTFAPATFSKWVAAIAHCHRRTYALAGDRPWRQMAPLLTSDIVAIVAHSRDTVTGWAGEVLERRDTALLLMGFAGAFRRSELDCGDIAVHRLDGVHVRLRCSKTDQDGTGAVKALPFTTSHVSCPPCAMLRCLQVVAAYERDCRPGVIRLLRTAPAFDSHLCRGPVPAPSPHSPLPTPHSPLPTVPVDR